MTRKVTIEITDTDGGFHVVMDVQPPIPDGTVPQPTAALIAGMVARRAIEHLVQQQQEADAASESRQEGGSVETN
jgi:hypothetical protein